MLTQDKNLLKLIYQMDTLIFLNLNFFKTTNYMEKCVRLLQLTL